MESCTTLGDYSTIMFRRKVDRKLKLDFVGRPSIVGADPVIFAQLSIPDIQTINKAIQTLLFTIARDKRSQSARQRDAEVDIEEAMVDERLCS